MVRRVPGEGGEEEEEERDVSKMCFLPRVLSQTDFAFIWAVNPCQSNLLGEAEEVGPSGQCLQKYCLTCTRRFCSRFTVSGTVSSSTGLGSGTVGGGGLNTGFELPNKEEGRVKDVHRFLGFLLLLLRRFHRLVPGQPVIILVPYVMNPMPNHLPSVPPTYVRGVNERSSF